MHPYVLDVGIAASSKWIFSKHTLRASNSKEYMVAEFAKMLYHIEIIFSISISSSKRSYKTSSSVRPYIHCLSKREATHFRNSEDLI
jgi:hypothetical protein